MRLPEGMESDFGNKKIMLFVSEAGFLFSSDVLELILKRCETIISKMTNDLWHSFIFRDIPCTSFLRYDFTAITTFDQSSRAALRSRITQACTEGHFHFRVNSGRWGAKGHLKHDPGEIEPLVLNEIMTEVICSPI